MKFLGLFIEVLSLLNFDIMRNRKTDNSSLPIVIKTRKRINDVITLFVKTVS